jgi:hypothetical protein
MNASTPHDLLDLRLDRFLDYVVTWMRQHMSQSEFEGWRMRTLEMPPTDAVDDGTFDDEALMDDFLRTMKGV